MPREPVRVGQWVRVGEQSVVIVLFSVFLILVMLAGLRAERPLLLIDVVVAGLIAGSAARFAMMGLLVEPTGIRVRNLLRTHRIAWSRIDAVRMGTWKRVFPRMGLVDLVDGRTIPIAGVVGPNPITRPNNRTAESLMDQLSNLFFAARANGGTVPPDMGGVENSAPAASIQPRPDPPVR
ncbi:MAG TPA: PH domain-containing protein [Actinomycetota bacterium]|jgi:hypothetical protein